MTISTGGPWCYTRVRVAEATAFSVDSKVVDNGQRCTGRMVRSASDWARPLQTGFVRNYGALFLAGALVVVVWLVAGG